MLIQNKIQELQLAIRKVTMSSLYNEGFHQAQNPPHIRESQQHGFAESEVIGSSIPSYPSYFDQYLSSSGELHLHFGLLDNRTIGVFPLRPSPTDYCAVFGKAVSWEHLEGQRDNLTSDRYTADRVQDSSTNDDKLTVLIRSIETANSSEHGTPRSASHFIRLGLYDHCQSFPRQSSHGGLKVFSLLGIIDHEFSIRVLRPDVFKGDWETSILTSLSRDRGGNDVVKCTSQVVYEVTEQQGNHRIRLLRNSYSVPDLSLTVRLPDTDKLVRIVAGICPGLSVDVYHVLLGTLDLEHLAYFAGHGDEP